MSSVIEGSAWWMRVRMWARVVGRQSGEGACGEGEAFGVSFFGLGLLFFVVAVAFFVIGGTPRVGGIEGDHVGETPPAALHRVALLERSVPVCVRVGLYGNSDGLKHFQLCAMLDHTLHDDRERRRVAICALKQQSAESSPPCPGVGYETSRLCAAVSAARFESQLDFEGRATWAYRGDARRWSHRAGRGRLGEHPFERILQGARPGTVTLELVLGPVAG
jgi:hypothetical protein